MMSFNSYHKLDSNSFQSEILSNAKIMITLRNFVVSRLQHLKLECNAKRSAVIGSYNIQGNQSLRGCVASASKIPSEYSCVASTKNDNALTWPAIQFQMKYSCNIPVYIWGCIFIDHTELDRSTVYLLG